MTTAILPDALDEARRIIAAGAEQKLTLRLLGGLAIKMHSPSAGHRALARSYPDLDFALADKRGYKVEALMPKLGYDPNQSFNLFNGASRLLFFDEGNQRQIDVFVGSFHMCHDLPITQRVAVEPLTLPLAELLLTKLQVVQLNEKDIRDICALLLDHPFGQTDLETINLKRITELCAGDWGLWKTVSLSLGKVQEFYDKYDLDPASKQTIVERLRMLQQTLDAGPKSMRWKVRAAVGEKVQWYDLPEEVKRG
jgi:hypothetical protein